jgi:hypothetical protein
MSQFAPQPYKAQSGFNLLGVLLLLVALCLAGLGLAWLGSFIAQWFYLIVLFPLAIGLGLAGVGALVNYRAKLRNAPLAALIGLLAAVWTMAAMHYFDYQRFVGQRDQLLRENPQLLNDGPAAGLTDPEEVEARRLLNQARGVDSLPKYLDLQATDGVRIGRGGDGATNLGYVGSWIYWGVELIILAAMSVGLMIANAREPYCTACDTWKKERELGTFVGDGQQVHYFLTTGDIESLSDYGPAKTGGNLVLSVAVCPNCQGDAPVEVNLSESIRQGKQETGRRSLGRLTFPGAAVPELESLFSQA